MKTLHFQRPNNLDVLHDELLTAIPALRPVPVSITDSEGITRQENHSSMTVQGSSDQITLTVPDIADEAAIAAVVLAHDHTKTQADPAQVRRDRMMELLAIGRTNWTAAQNREVVELTLQEIIR